VSSYWDNAAGDEEERVLTNVYCWMQHRRPRTRKKRNHADVHAAATRSTMSRTMTRTLPRSWRTCWFRNRFIPSAVNGYRTSTSTANERFFSDLILVWNEGIIHAEERASLLWMDLGTHSSIPVDTSTPKLRHVYFIIFHAMSCHPPPFPHLFSFSVRPSVNWESDRAWVLKFWFSRRFFSRKQASHE
jgi:hypothetical protein